MRYGIFSDTHANLHALEAVLRAFDREHVDALVCLGDTVGYGAQPNECCDRVRSLTKYTILGNHDAAVAGRMDYSYYYEAARHALDVHASQLTPENMAWLKGLPYRHTLGDVGVDLCHGSPLRLEEFEYIFAPEQARECLAIWDELQSLTLIGHSHLCKVFALRP
ncbi:MAG TPA: metallophosphoesterase family protein, partial [Nannocystaceae bacterium]|nr:metallophosphoesterase family protein [Nannocystaceae bacterium]